MIAAALRQPAVRNLRCVHKIPMIAQKPLEEKEIQPDCREAVVVGAGEGNASHTSATITSLTLAGRASAPAVALCRLPEA